MLSSAGACDNGYSYACGSTSGGMLAWSSAIFDTLRNRMVVWGGGHGDYKGNELYALDLDDLTLTMITTPGSPTATSCVEALVNNTQPNSRHTYDGLCYLAGQDRLFAYGGCLTCGSGDWSKDTWTFSFATMTWRRMYSGGDIPNKDCDAICDCDPNTGKVFLNDRTYFSSYDPKTNRYTRLSANGATFGLGSMGVIDPKRKKFVHIGGGAAHVWDISEGSAYAMQALATTGGSAIVSSQYPGLDYDPVRDRIVAWNGGNTVYSLDMDTRQWTGTTYSGGPGNPALNLGTFKRWRYCKALDAFVLVNNYSQNAFIFRFWAAAAESRAAAAGNLVSVSPNPFKSSTVIRCLSGRTTGISVYDLSGRLVQRLTPSAGGTMTWKAGHCPAGIYLLRGREGGKIFTLKLFLEK
jgi:hypothetical protein